jgi:hypothetical protein
LQMLSSSPGGHGASTSGLPFGSENALADATNVMPNTSLNTTAASGNGGSAPSNGSASVSASSAQPASQQQYQQQPQQQQQQQAFVYGMQPYFGMPPAPTFSAMGAAPAGDTNASKTQNRRRSSQERGDGRNSQRNKR